MITITSPVILYLRDSFADCPFFMLMQQLRHISYCTDSNMRHLAVVLCTVVIILIKMFAIDTLFGVSTPGFKFFYEFYILRCLKSQRIFAIEAEDFLVFVKFLHTKKVVFSVHNFFCSMHDHFNFV